LQYPRGIDLGDGVLYVADTFGNRILGLDAITGMKRFEVSSHFPNSIQFIGESVLVAEEHLNSATEFSINLKRKPAKLACRTVRGLENMVSMRTRMNSVGDDGESVCRVNPNTFIDDLFSPNDYQSLDGFSYIADTDNHRIIVFDGDVAVSFIKGFNSPVNIRVLRKTGNHPIVH
jgi:hypothetical protein